jgi:SAM-dependent methyltransferase
VQSGWADLNRRLLRPKRSALPTALHPGPKSIMPWIIIVKQTMDSYSLLARFYDLENADFTEDLPFWADLAREHGGPVLELGCGTGRVLLHLAREGFEVVGVDSSAEMIARARRRIDLQKKTAGRIQIVEGNFSSLALGKTFPLVILPFNTFAHLTADSDLQAALGAISSHLAPGGRVVLALPNPIPIFGTPSEGLVLERTFRDEERNLSIQQFSSLRLDRVAQLGHILWLYDEIDSTGRVTRASVPMVLRYFFPNELKMLFGQAGLRLLHLWGDYDRTPFMEDSPAFIAAGGHQTALG